MEAQAGEFTKSRAGSQMLSGALAAAMMMAAPPNVTIKSGPAPKIPLTNKQKKNRAATKKQRAARKITRKHS